MIRNNVVIYFDLSNETTKYLTEETARRHSATRTCSHVTAFVANEHLYFSLRLTSDEGNEFYVKLVILGNFLVVIRDKAGVSLSAILNALFKSDSSRGARFQ